MSNCDKNWGETCEFFRGSLLVVMKTVAGKVVIFSRVNEVVVVWLWRDYSDND